MAQDASGGHTQSAFMPGRRMQEEAARTTASATTGKGPPCRRAATVRPVSNSGMAWLISLCLWLALLALIAGVAVASVRNARALRRDINERFDAMQARLEQQANALADELLARTKDPTE